jgi:hypothetical protein
MSDPENLARFADRVARVAAGRGARRRGALIVCADQQQGAGSSWISLRQVAFVLMVIVMLKALAIGILSEGTYRTHLLYLDETSVLESLLAAVLAPDPVSLALSRFLPL